MPTSFTDQFFVIDPYSPPPSGTAMNFSVFTLIDQNDDNDIDRFNNDSVDGFDVVSSWPGDVVTVNVPGVGNITYTGTTFYLSDGRQVFTPTDGQVLQNGTLVGATGVTTQGPLDVTTDLGPACFTRGAMINTIDGPRAIETLKPGDFVMTRDNGPQEIRWIGRQVMRAIDKFAPIRFCKGSIGNTKDITVSQQHRMLITGWQAELFFGEEEILVAAKHLVNHDTIHVSKQQTVEYLHLLFDDHEIIEGDGVYSESFFPGHAIDGADQMMCQEIMEIFPELSKRPVESWKLARPEVRKFEAMLLAA